MDTVKPAPRSAATPAGAEDALVASKCPSCDCEFSDDALSVANRNLAAMQVETERYRDALIKIQQWAYAYPLDLFPEPDLKRAHELLKAGGMGLDAISASAMRHVLSGVIGIVDATLFVEEELREQKEDQS